MGWDCWATKDGKRLKIEWGDYTDPFIKDEVTDQAFSLQSQVVKDDCGSADGWLRLGGLDCSLCAEMLEKATGKNCWSDEDWSAEHVKYLGDTADWNFEVDPGEMWAYLSTKHFLDTCADLGLGISFSW